MHTLLSALCAHAAAEPSRPALLFANGKRFIQFTYEDLLDETERWAARFLTMGLAPQSTVAIVLDHRIDLYGACLGAMRAGLVPAFLSWRTQADVLGTLRPSCVVTCGDVLGRVRDALHGGACIVMNVDDTPLDPPANLPTLASVEGGEHIALIQLSSATAGATTRVALTYGAIRERVAARAIELSSSRTDRVVSSLPLDHDSGLFAALLSPVTLGAAVVALDASDWLDRPASFLEVVERYAATHAWLPNVALDDLVRTHDVERPYDLSSLRALVCSSEPCTPETLATLATTFADARLAPNALRCARPFAMPLEVPHA